VTATGLPNKHVAAVRARPPSAAPPLEAYRKDYVYRDPAKALDEKALEAERVRLDRQAGYKFSDRPTTRDPRKRRGGRKPKKQPEPVTWPGSTELPAVPEPVTPQPDTRPVVSLEPEPVVRDLRKRCRRCGYFQGSASCLTSHERTK
jgi:hypothetical protein